MPFIYDAPFAQTPKSNAVDLTAAVAVGTAGTVIVTANTCASCIIDESQGRSGAVHAQVAQT